VESHAWLLIATAAVVGAAWPGRAAAGSPIKDDEEVLLFGTVAHQDGKDWVVPLHCWIYEREADSRWRAGALRGLRKALGLADGDAREARFATVAGWFLVDYERGKRIPVRIGTLESILDRSAASGHARGLVRVPLAGAGDWITVETSARDGRRFTGRVRLVAPTGLSVVSDVDDTIKVTEVLAGKSRVLERTFLEPFEPVGGMAPLYRSWSDRGAVFHYVSASPWHLYPELAAFVAASGLPEGSFHLRDFRFKDSTRWNLLESPRSHKSDAIEELLARFPQRRFVLIGDTGERDPEIYGELARRHPGRIATILIRRLDADGWTDSRSRTAFAHVTAPVHLFRDPAELPPLASLDPSAPAVSPTAPRGPAAIPSTPRR
jgi:hypothetical protein